MSWIKVAVQLKLKVDTYMNTNMHRLQLVVCMNNSKVANAYTWYTKIGTKNMNTMSRWHPCASVRILFTDEFYWIFFYLDELIVLGICLSYGGNQRQHTRKESPAKQKQGFPSFRNGISSGAKILSNSPARKYSIRWDVTVDILLVVISTEYLALIDVHIIVLFCGSHESWNFLAANIKSDARGTKHCFPTLF